jgi:hypothetical protein
MSRGKCRYQIQYGALRVKPCGKPSKPGHPRGYCEEHANQTAREGRKR